jgi:hypothetical protein
MTHEATQNTLDEDTPSLSWSKQTLPSKTYHIKEDLVRNLIRLSGERKRNGRACKPIKRERWEARLEAFLSIWTIVSRPRHHDDNSKYTYAWAEPKRRVEMAKKRDVKRTFIVDVYRVLLVLVKNNDPYIFVVGMWWICWPTLTLMQEAAGSFEAVISNHIPRRSSSSRSPSFPRPTAQTCKSNNIRE